MGAEHSEAKRAIGEAVYGLLLPHLIFLDIGITVLQLAWRLRMQPLALTIMVWGPRRTW